MFFEVNLTKSKFASKQLSDHYLKWQKTFSCFWKWQKTFSCFLKWQKTFSCIVSRRQIRTPFHLQLPSLHQMLLRFLKKKLDNDEVWICVDIKTCSWGGNIHIHNATVRTLGAQPLQIRNNCWKVWNIFIHMSTWKTLPMSLVKMDELSPCSTSLFHRMPSSKLEHFKMYTIGANVSLREKHVSYGTLQRFFEDRPNRRRKKLQIVSHSEYVWGIHYKWFFTRTKSLTSRKNLRT